MGDGKETIVDSINVIAARGTTILAPFLLLAIGVAHIIWHEKVALDWQATALLITGVVFLFLPLREIAARVLKLKVGNFEVELREATEVLSQKVAEAEATTEFAAKIAEDVDPGPGQRAASDHEHSTEEDETAGRRANPSQPQSWTKKPRHYRVDFDEVTALRYEVDQLRGISPKAGLIRLAAAIEQAVIKMATPLKPPQKQRVRSFSMALDLLFRNQKVSAPLAQALSQFWRLRNKIAHQSAPVDDDVVTNAVDDGFRLLLILNVM